MSLVNDLTIRFKETLHQLLGEMLVAAMRRSGSLLVMSQYIRERSKTNIRTSNLLPSASGAAHYS